MKYLKRLISNLYKRCVGSRPKVSGIPVDTTPVSTPPKEEDVVMTFGDEGLCIIENKDDNVPMFIDDTDKVTVSKLGTHYASKLNPHYNKVADTIAKIDVAYLNDLSRRAEISQLKSLIEEPPRIPIGPAPIFNADFVVNNLNKTNGIAPMDSCNKK